MLKIGITGGIGSGKTTVCKIFESLGIPVYYADDRAKAIMVNDPNLVAQIKKLLGNEAYQSDGLLDRGYISNIVFNDPAKLKQLNAIVHPAVGKDGQHWQAAQKDVPFTLKEAALLIESKSYKTLDYLVTVWAPQELRIERVMKRDQTTRQAILARMNKQMPEFEKLDLADFVIINDGNHSLVEQVIKLYRRLSEK